MHVSAAADVGSTSLHLLVAGSNGDDLEVLLDTSAFLELGPGLERQPAIGAPRTGDLVEALRRYVLEARRLGAAELALVGTEPLRRALDAAAVVRRVEREAGLALHVLSAEEEALLTLIGVTGGRRPPGQLLVVDIGGGSSELILADGVDRPVVRAIPAGAARLGGPVELHDPPTADELAALGDAARQAVVTAPQSGPAGILAVGGTADNVLLVVPDATLGRDLTAGRLAAAQARLQSEPAELLAGRTGIRLRRARLLPAGVAILGALLERYAADRITVSSAGLREGLILAGLQAGRAWRDALPRLARGWR